MEFERGDVGFYLNRRNLSVRFASKRTSVAAARAEAEPLLRDWEFQDALKFGFSSARFAFVDAEVVGDVPLERDPPEQLTYVRRTDGPPIIALHHFDAPPELRVTPALAAAWSRWERARAGIGESTQSAAYFVLTTLETMAGGRKEAAFSFAIDLAVLRRLGELASTTGSALTSRKASAVSAELSSNERNWLHSAVRHCLYNAALRAAGKSPESVRLDQIGAA